MCRLLAWLGDPIDLEALLYLQPQSLHKQSWAPLEQRHGTINADGWGVGWYQPEIRPEPARYRTARPMWSDASFRSMAPVLTSGCVLAAVRSATPPLAVDDVNTPPFTSERWLFAHNGAVPGWTHGVGEAARRAVSERRASTIEGSTDSEVLFALALDALDEGADPQEALGTVVDHVGTGRDARLTMLLTDGERIAGAVHGDTLGWMVGVRSAGSSGAPPLGILVASEPPIPRAEFIATDPVFVAPHEAGIAPSAAGVWHDLDDGTRMTWTRSMLRDVEGP